MHKGKLRIIKRTLPALGRCELCKAHFKSSKQKQISAMVEIAEAFNAHECKPVDSRQNDLRIGRESTENK